VHERQLARGVGILDDDGVGSRPLDRRPDQGRREVVVIGAVAVGQPAVEVGGGVVRTRLLSPNGWTFSMVIAAPEWSGVWAWGMGRLLAVGAKPPPAARFTALSRRGLAGQAGADR
jgi:hypothetical protein